MQRAMQRQMGKFQTDSTISMPRRSTKLSFSIIFVPAAKAKAAISINVPAVAANNNIGTNVPEAAGPVPRAFAAAATVRETAATVQAAAASKR